MVRENVVVKLESSFLFVAQIFSGNNAIEEMTPAHRERKSKALQRCCSD